MRLYHSPAYPNSKPGEVAVTFPLLTHNTGNGRDTTLSDFRSRTFWRNAVPANATTAFAPPDHGLGFSDLYWIFSTVESLGYPILRASPNGLAMEGQ